MPVALTLFACAGADAMSIGEIDVSSHLGEPLRARVPLVLDEGTLPRDECIRIVGPARHHPDLADARVTLISQGGRYFAAIATNNPVNDPMLDLSLRSDGCGPSLQKDFVLMLVPKDMAIPIAPPVVSYSGETGEQARPAVAVAVAVAPPLAKAPAKRVRPRVAAAPAPRRPAPAPRSHAVRHVLKLDYGYDAFGRMAEEIAQRRQAAYSTPDSAAQPAQSAGLVLQPPPADFQPLGQGEPGTAASGSAGSGTASSPQTGPDGVSARQGGIAAGPASGSSSWQVWLTSPWSLPILLVPLVLALAIALWLKRRAPRSRFMDTTPPDLDTMPPGLDSMAPDEPEDPRHHPLWSNEPATVDAWGGEPAEANALLAAGLEPRPPSPAVAPLEFTPGTGPAPDRDAAYTVSQHDSVDQAMELAEVMLAFGRAGQAIETLSQHIQANPRQALAPWLKLLDLYHQSNLRDEFEALSADLNKYFNVAMTSWDEFGADAERPVGPLTLESLPHIMNRLTETWGTPECLDFIDRLMEDNRGGQRLGFSMPIVRDILLLRDILRQTCPVGALSH